MTYGDPFLRLWRLLYPTVCNIANIATIRIIKAASHIKLKKAVLTNLKNLYFCWYFLGDEDFPFFVDQKSAKNTFFLTFEYNHTYLKSTTHYKIGKIKSNLFFNSGI